MSEIDKNLITTSYSTNDKVAPNDIEVDEVTMNPSGNIRASNMSRNSLKSSMIKEQTMVSSMIARNRYGVIT